MKPTCDLCARPATRHYHPGDHARCGLHEYNDRASVPSGTSVALTRRPPPPDTADRAQIATVRPPADERCPRCSRILIATPCGCASPVDRAIASGRAHRADMAGLSTAEKLTVWRALGVTVAEATGALGSASCT